MFDQLKEHLLLLLSKNIYLFSIFFIIYFINFNTL